MLIDYEKSNTSKVCINVLFLILKHRFQVNNCSLSVSMVEGLLNVRCRNWRVGGWLVAPMMVMILNITQLSKQSLLRSSFAQGSQNLMPFFLFLIRQGSYRRELVVPRQGSSIGSRRESVVIGIIVDGNFFSSLSISNINQKMLGNGEGGEE